MEHFRLGGESRWFTNHGFAGMGFLCKLAVGFQDKWHRFGQVPVGLFEGFSLCIGNRKLLDEGCIAFR